MPRFEDPKVSAEIDALIAKVNKRFKAKLLVYASDIPVFHRVTTGSLSFDLMLGGGWPLNCWNEIVGNESHGKTVVALKTLAANQAANPRYEALWVASEDFNKAWAADLGVDLDRLVIAQTNIMEEAYEIMIDALDERSVDAIVLDSYPALIPTSEGEGDMDQWVVGLGARLTNKLMRKSPPAQRRNEGERDCLCLIINQWRDRVGVVFGDPRTTPGGKGKNFSYFTRVEVARDSWIEDKEAKVKVGLVIKALGMKNKTAPPQRVGSTPFYFTDHKPFHKGDYDSVTQVFNIALTYDIFTLKGNQYHRDGDQWTGKAAVLQALREDLDLRHAVDTEVRRLLLGAPAEEEAPATKPRRARKKAT